MNLADLLDAVRRDPLAVSIPAEWAQGRASFGGLMVALQYTAMRAQVPAERLLRSLAITFVGPAAPDVPIRFEVEVLREGKAVSQVLGRAVQDGQVVTLVQGSFGAGRESAVAVAAQTAPAIKHWQECQEVPYIKGVTPEFLRHLALRWGLGGLPFSNSRSRELGGWVRLRGEVADEPATEAHLLALLDAWPPALMPHLSKPAAGSTLTWTVEFVQPLPQVSTLDWCKYRAEIDQASDGYGHVAASMWSAEGELIAMSRQTVTVFG